MRFTPWPGSGVQPHKTTARFATATFTVQTLLEGSGTLLTNWTTREQQPGEAEGLKLDLGDLLCRFTAS